MATAPSFPPLLNGHRIAASKNLVKKALSMAAKKQTGAGDLLWLDDPKRLQFALTLEPEVATGRCAEMLYTAMVAFGDSAGALCPPETSVTYRWPNQILMNDAMIGYCDLLAAPLADHEPPDWIILVIDVAVKPPSLDRNPGEMPEWTTMWDEGCGDVSCVTLLESTSRHLLNWIHTWTEEGFKPVHQQWIGRLSEKTPLVPVTGNWAEAELVGLDEIGNALMKSKGEITTTSLFDGLDKVRDSNRVYA